MIKQTIKMLTHWSILLPAIILLSGCKVAAYHNLSESESNQMLGLLLSNNISASKDMAGKEGQVTLMVEESHLVDALDILHSSGYPQRKFDTVNQIFPPGQLITSPEQQKVKMIYAKEQQLDHMLSQIPGVISSNVQLNDHISTDMSALERNPKPPTAAALIVYSLKQNTPDYMVQIRSLIRNSMPGLTDENLSVVMMPANNSVPVKSSKADDSVSKSILSAITPVAAATSPGSKGSAGEEKKSYMDNFLSRYDLTNNTLFNAMVVLLLILCLSGGALFYIFRKNRVALRQSNT